MPSDDRRADATGRRSPRWILVGPFLTCAEAAHCAGLPESTIDAHPDLLRIAGPEGEAYFGFQFTNGGIDPRLGHVVQTLKRGRDDLVIADWLVRANPALDGASPLGWLTTGHPADQVIDADPSRSSDT